MKPKITGAHGAMPPIRALLDKVDTVRDYLNAQVLERENETDGILYAMLSGVNTLFVGDVGTSKTRHIELASHMFGCTMFDTLLSETTKPEFIFGPTDVPALARGIQRQKIAGYAPAAEVLFLDEIFKASGVVLNPLLWLINEHKFRNGDEGIIQCPTRTVFSASNEVPNDPELRAIYDRFLLRYHVSYLKSPENINRMIDMNLGGGASVPPPALSRAELDHLREARATVTIPAEVRSVALRIRDQVGRSCGVVIGDRRYAACMKVVQAAAMLARRRVASTTDLEVLSHTFWDKPEQEPKVRALVFASATKESSDLLSYSDVATDVWETAIKSGDMVEAAKKLRELSLAVKGFDSPTGKRVVRTIHGYLERAQEILRDREGMAFTVIPSRKTGYYLRLSDASASCWSQKQLHALGLHWRVAGGYWWVGLTKNGAQLGPAVKRVQLFIYKATGIKPKVRMLGRGS